MIMNSKNKLSYTLNNILELSNNEVKKQRTMIIGMLIDKILLDYRTYVQSHSTFLQSGLNYPPYDTQASKLPSCKFWIIPQLLLHVLPM